MLTRVAGPYTVEIQWTEPAEPNGIITNYTVYVSQQPTAVVAPIAPFVPAAFGAPEPVEPFTKVSLSREITPIRY